MKPVGEEEKKLWEAVAGNQPLISATATMARMEKDAPGEFRTMMGVLNGFCPNCGGPVKHNPLGRPKKFCSEKCRSAYNHRHAHPENWKNTSREVVCPVCGNKFTAAREYGRLRKYCSRACANRGRAMKKREENGDV